MFGDELLNRKQLAKELGISCSRLEVLVKAGLPYRQLGNSRKYYVLAEVKEWLLRGSKE